MISPPKSRFASLKNSSTNVKAKLQAALFIARKNRKKKLFAASAVWSITPGDGQATVDTFPAFSGTWLITPGDGQATVNNSPGVV